MRLPVSIVLKTSTYLFKHCNFLLRLSPLVVSHLMLLMLIRNFLCRCCLFVISTLSTRINCTRKILAMISANCECLGLYGFAMIDWRG